MGTLVYSSVAIGALATIVDGLSGDGGPGAPCAWRVLWSFPDRLRDRLAEAGKLDALLAPGSHFRLSGWVNQVAVLRHAQVRCFVTHGGGSSFNEALIAGVPMVFTPYMCDQYESAAAGVSRGLGHVYHKWRRDAPTLRALVRSALDARGPCAAACARYAPLMRVNAGPSRGVAVLENMAWGGARFDELSDDATRAARRRASPARGGAVPARLGGAVAVFALAFVILKASRFGRSAK